MTATLLFAISCASCALFAQEQQAEPPAAKPPAYLVQTGTRVPLVMINSISTKHASEGDRVYLESSFPIVIDGRIVIPPGSYVAGTITSAKRAGRVKGKSELYLRFDSLTLPNGVTRDFRARVGGLDGRSGDELDRTEGRIKGEGAKGRDAIAVASAAGIGTSVGSVVGSRSAGGGAMGAGIGAAAGATAGLIGVLLTRGPDIILGRGTVVEMVLDRPLEFQASELDFSNGGGYRTPSNDGGGPAKKRTASTNGLPGSRVSRVIP